MIREGLVPDRSMSGTVLYLKYSIWLTRSQKKCYPQTWFTIVKRSFNLALADTASFKKMSISFYWIFGILKKWIIFLAVQDNSIGDLASQSVIESCFDFRAIQSLQSLRLASDVWLRSWCLVEILNTKFDQGLCLNLWYDLKKLLQQDELNPLWLWQCF